LPAGDDYEQLLELWRESERRSRARRAVARRHRSGTLLLAGALVAVALGFTSHGRRDDSLSSRTGDAAQARLTGRSPADGAVRGRAVIPSRAAMRDAWRFARRRGGQVSFAVVDTRGRLRGRDADRRYVSASVVKALLLAAELRRLERDERALDPATNDLLTAMIAHSDNDSADAIYTRVGDPGLLEVAKDAGMRRFGVKGHWANAQVTAADLARFFSRLRKLLPRRHRGSALRLLAAIEREQSWGVPRAAGSGWRVHFKGGWRETGRGELVHQAAWLHGGGRKLAIAVLSDAQPSRVYGIHTVRGIADRLLARSQGATR
jgi:hypothetical protein